MEVLVNDPPTSIGENELVTRVVCESHKKIMGKESPFIIRRTGADSTHLNRYDVPCLTYGPGGRTHPDAKALMHAVGEHAHVDNLLAAAKVYADVALTLCSHSAPDKI